MSEKGYLCLKLFTKGIRLLSLTRAIDNNSRILYTGTIATLFLLSVIFLSLTMCGAEEGSLICTTKVLLSSNSFKNSLLQVPDNLH